MSFQLDVHKKDNRCRLLHDRAEPWQKIGRCHKQCSPTGTKTLWVNFDVLVMASRVIVEVQAHPKIQRPV